jgi:hypothetical protein
LAADRRRKAAGFEVRYSEWQIVNPNCCVTLGTVNLILHNFHPHVPRRDVYERDIDYRVFEMDVEANEALFFTRRLVDRRDSLYLESTECGLEIRKHEGAIWVEITCANFWATSKVSSEETKAIIERLEVGKGFASRIPTTGREWDAYWTSLD